MALAIRLARGGMKKRPYYRIVVTDSRNPRDGRTLEEVGFYHPIEVEDKQVSFKEERVREWLKNGAEPSETVRRLLNRKNFRVK